MESRNKTGLESVAEVERRIRTENKNPKENKTMKRSNNILYKYHILIRGNAGLAQVVVLASGCRDGVCGWGALMVLQLLEQKVLLLPSKRLDDESSTFGWFGL